MNHIQNFISIRAHRLNSHDHRTHWQGYGVNFVMSLCVLCYVSSSMPCHGSDAQSPACLGKPGLNPGPSQRRYSADSVALGRVSALLWFFLVIITPVLDTRLHHGTVIRRTNGQSLDTFRGTIFRLSQHLTESDIFVVQLFAENWVNLVL